MFPAFEELNSDKDKNAQELCHSRSSVSAKDVDEWFLDDSGVWTELQNTEGDRAPMFQPQVKEIRDLRELAVLEGLFVMCHYWSVKSMEESWERPWMLGESICYSF